MTESLDDILRKSPEALVKCSPKVVRKERALGLNAPCDSTAMGWKIYDLVSWYYYYYGRLDDRLSRALFCPQRQSASGIWGRSLARNLTDSQWRLICSQDRIYSQEQEARGKKSPPSLFTVLSFFLLLPFSSLFPVSIPSTLSFLNFSQRLSIFSSVRCSFLPQNQIEGVGEICQMTSSRNTRTNCNKQKPP